MNRPVGYLLTGLLLLAALAAGWWGWQAGGLQLLLPGVGIC